MRTTYIVKKADVKRKWYVVDATDHTLGRLSSEVAKILRGKHKPTYTPHVDMGDYVIIINAEKIKVTGNKENDKLYTHHTGYTGGLRQVAYKKMMQKKPDFILYHAIKGMLPKSSLGHNIIRNLHVYAGPEHLHEAQKPELLEIKY